MTASAVLIDLLCTRSYTEPPGGETSARLPRLQKSAFDSKL